MRSPVGELVRVALGMYSPAVHSSPLGLVATPEYRWAWPKLGQQIRPGDGEAYHAFALNAG